MKAELAATKLAEAHEMKRSVSAGFDKQAKTAAAALADKLAAMEEREAAARDRAHNEGVIEQLRVQLRALRARAKAVGDWSDA